MGIPSGESYTTSGYLLVCVMHFATFKKKVALELATTSRIYLVYYFSILIILVFTSMTAKIDPSHFKCSISKFITPDGYWRKSDGILITKHRSLASKKRKAETSAQKHNIQATNKVKFRIRKESIYMCLF